MKSTKKMTLTAMLVAVTTLTSSFIYIPLGFVKIFPVQHLMNVLSAVLLGPVYAISQAFLVSLFRNMMGTGSLFAFPGSMIGALLAALVYQRTKNMAFTCIGEMVGTGILGSLACYPLALFFLGEKVALFGFLPAFLASSFTGAFLAFLVLKLLLKNRYVEQVFFNYN